MNTTNTPPTAPANADPELIPLSLLFPELDPNEALDGSTVVVMERRARVMYMYRHGRSLREIADTLHCSPGLVHRDLHIVLEGYAQIAFRSAKEHMADCLQRLATQETELKLEWERSKQEVVETLVEKMVQEGKSARVRVVERKKKQGGNSRLLALLLGCWDRHCKLLGLLKGELPPQVVVKTFSGVDIAEQVGGVFSVDLRAPGLPKEAKEERVPDE